MADVVQDVVTQINNEPAQQPANQPAQPASQAPVDPDDAEVAAARAAVEADAKGTAQPQPPSDKAPAAQPAPQPQPAAAAAAPQTPQAPQQPSQPSGEGGDGIMIPKGRFDEALARSAEKDRVIARLQGENQALKMVVKPGEQGANPQAPAQPQAETHDQKLERIYAAKEALAKKFDDGDISMADLRKEERKLDNEIEQVREARLSEKFKAQAPQQQPTAPPADDMRLEEKTQELEGKHPYIATPEVMQEDHWQFLLVEAAQQLRAQGVQFPEGPLPANLRYQLREKVCQLSDTYGPIWGAKLPQGAQTPKPQPSAQPQSGMSPQAQARANKLEQAANAPPDINRLTPQGAQTEYTEDMIATMSDDEILALPASVRARFSTA